MANGQSLASRGSGARGQTVGKPSRTLRLTPTGGHCTACVYGTATDWVPRGHRAESRVVAHSRWLNVQSGRRYASLGREQRRLGLVNRRCGTKRTSEKDGSEGGGALTDSLQERRRSLDRSAPRQGDSLVWDGKGSSSGCACYVLHCTRRETTSVGKTGRRPKESSEFSQPRPLRRRFREEWLRQQCRYERIVVRHGSRHLRCVQGQRRRPPYEPHYTKWTRGSVRLNDGAHKQHIRLAFKLQRRPLRAPGTHHHSGRRREASSHL